MMYPRPFSFALLIAISGLLLSACEGEGVDLGQEDSGVGTDGDTRTHRDGGRQPADSSNTTFSCGPVGEVSCMNGNELVRCLGDRYETVETCDQGCVFVGQTLTCEGGARTFTPINVGLIADGAVRASISTISGAVGCGLVDDYELSPGLAAEQVYLVLANVGFGCTDGVYGLNATCDVSYPTDSSARCAIYRRWNGSRLEAVEALSGAVTISSAQSGVCNFEVDLILGGQQQTIRFSASASQLGAETACLTPM